MSELIQSSELNDLIISQPPIILDCRTNLGNRSLSKQLYLESHIPSAQFADLESDLSGQSSPDNGGRHPLPSANKFTKTLQRWGIESERHVVVYDADSGMFAARAWWLLKWAGVKKVSLLNGGFQAWRNNGFDVTSQTLEVKPSSISIAPPVDWTISREEILASNNLKLLDARAIERYSGANEPLDPVAGHIPGAESAEFTKNLNQDMTFKTKDELLARFNQLKNEEKITVCYCGSGVTACHNILAFIEAGLPQPKLYVGSWSDWSSNTENRISTGIEGKVW